MKTPASAPGPARSAGGFALILVLGLIVLIVAILVAFLLSTTTERNASSGFAASVTARQLGDTAVSLIEAQINRATTYAPAGTSVAWTSQPGLLRTFNQNGSLLDLYKLYSADQMITAAQTDDADQPTADWTKNPALWVDLNARASAGTDPATGKENYVYPILDPRAASRIDNAMDGLGNGFTITSTAPAFTNVSAQADGIPPAPMPVRWLYVMQNGKAVAPAGGSGASVTFAEDPSNPVVGRIAFWTDDDTCKVNINTASEGSFWDTPHGYTNHEVYDLAVKQPARGEYQRYPGHPATVSLTSVFPNLTAEQIYTLIPRVTGETDNPNGTGWTSNGGTQIPKPVTNPTTRGVVSDGERLFTSVDELMFKGKRDATGSDTNKRTPVNSSVAALTRNVVESRRFFLTAQSRAPETNLFNLPRIATWPIYRLGNGGAVDLLRTNPFDRMIALCSSLGTTGGTATQTQFTQPYFFQRSNSKDAVYDLGDPDPSGTAGVGGIPRNLQLYQYLRDLTNTPVPGFGGGNFNTKYGADRDQILTEMFDYVRCTNLYDDLLDYSSTGTLLSPRGQYTFTNSIVGASGDPGHSFVAPIRGPGSTMGQGRYYTLRELDICLIACAQNSATTGESANNTDNLMLNEPFPSGPATKLAAKQTRVQALVLPEFFSTMNGWRVCCPDMRVEIEGLDKLALISGGVPTNLRLPSLAGLNLTGDPQALTGGTGVGAALVPVYAAYYKTTNRASAPAPGVPTTPLANSSIYPFVGYPCTVPNSNLLYLGLDAGAANATLKVRLYVPHTGTVPVQQFTINVPTTSIPIPTVSAKGKTFYSDGCGTAYPAGRLNISNSESITDLLDTSGTDVIRALIPANAAGTPGVPDLKMDYRIVASTFDVQNVYGFHPWSSMIAKFTAFMDGTKDPGGKLVTGAGTVDRDIPSATTVPPAQATGDFDLGMGHTRSGAGVNKPDEGDFNRQNNSNVGALKDPVEGKTIPYYYDWNGQTSVSATYFSPNRIIPSPVMFGSLPTGVKSQIPWRTLLFRPLSTEETGHLGATAPKDHLLLDLFWMPIVDPYAISDRFSTAGKINLNHKIIPFTYLERTTALRAAMKAEEMTRITTADTKLDPAINSGSFPVIPTTDCRYPLDLDQMIIQFEKTRFSDASLKSQGKNVFVSPSEICEMYMIPKTTPAMSYTAMAADWANYRQTGDNMREKIYATIYPKLTTRSNTYTVHFRAQALKRAPNSQRGTWTEGRDSVQGEYRGATTIERFIDPNPATAMPDYATADATSRITNNLNHFYKWRVVQNTQFAP